MLPFITIGRWRARVLCSAAYAALRRARSSALPVALYACLGTLAPDGFAQTLPLPIVPPPAASPPTPAGSSPETEAITEAPALRLWEYMLGASGGYSSNLYFLPQGPGGTVLAPRAELTRVSRGTAGEGRVAAAVGALAYLAATEQVAFDAALSASGRHQASDRTTFTGEISGGLGHTDDDTLLSEQGVLLPFSRTRFGRAEAGVLLKPGARTTLELRGRAYYDDFVSPELVDGRSLRGSLNLGRRLGERSDLSAEYSVELARSEASYTTQFASLQLGRRLSGRTSILIEGGASYAGAAGSDRQPTWDFYGGASLARVSGPSSVVVYARREVIPAFGIGGVGLTDRVGLRASSRIGPTWDLSAEAAYFRRASQDGGDQSDSEEARVALRKTVGPRFELGSELQYRRNTEGPGQRPIEQFRAQLTVAVLSPHTGGVRP